ncbi:lysozyme family protein [Siccirubricoccus phaeus]|uniref:lytic transglycosylase domain-containing protein n=1 Tax=Siccirubricoccus phaeus TaxID=2595053 RepID=UPI0011F30F35|nr:lytic transglycosylase domain-containing protein [Siccirubricoccus phaeus]
MPALPLLLLALALAWPAMAQNVEQGQLCRAAIATVEREANLPPRLLAAIGRVESGRRDPESGAFHPWPWTINAEGRGSFFPDKPAAIAAVRQLQAQGVRSIDVGCLQINLRHHPNAFASLEEAFDPLANARYAARFLIELQAARGDWMVSASHYHSQTPDFASAYRTRVTAALLAEQGTPEAPATAMAALRPQPAPAAPIPGSGGFMLSNGADRAALTPAAPGTVGRGLAAYRALPIPLAGRTPIAGARRL